MRVGVVALLLLLLVGLAQGQPTPASSATQERATGQPTEILPPATATSIPTPTRPAVYLPVLALGPVQRTITVQHVSAEYRSSSYWVYGEVVSTLDAPVEFVRIVGKFYDANNNFIATSSSYTSMDVVYPNEPTPFSILVLNPPPGITSQSFTTTSSSLSSFSDLRISVVSALVRDNSGPEVYGEVRNNQAVPLQFVRVVVAYYDAAGNVIYTDSTYTPSDTLAPGATDVYQVSSFRSDLSFSRFTVKAEGSPP